MKDGIITQHFIQTDDLISHVVRPLYICTVPRKGLQADKCYPDAQKFGINGYLIGWSEKEKTAIVPTNIPESKVDICLDILKKELRAKQK